MKNASSREVLSEIEGAFFDSVLEEVDGLEQLLLGDGDAPEATQALIDAVFRAVHTVKGGAAIFAMDEIVRLAHEMEAVCSALKQEPLIPNHEWMSVFLRGCDAFRAMVKRRRGAEAHAADGELDRLRARLRGLVPASSQADSPAHQHPRHDLASEADVEAKAAEARTTEAQAAEAQTAEAQAAELRGGELRVAELRAEAQLADAHPADAHPADPQASELRAAEAGEAQRVAGPRLAASRAKDAASFAVPAETAEAASSRIDLRKLDQLLECVGDLVNTQGTFARAVSSEDPVIARDALVNGMAQLERSMRKLQQAAMSIRMAPLTSALARLRRAVNELAGPLGKEVDLRLSGYGVELDRGLMERIMDPLVHLVRNCLDHGIEPPEEREALGKPRRGSIAVSASQHDGHVLIEIADDGRGLKRSSILAKASERGLAVAPEMSDAQVWRLILEPGFSTASAVTEISGRGMGMDVVRRTIEALGGEIDIQSSEGAGTRITLRVPLTLAILEGMLIGVGAQLFVIPLAGLVQVTRQPAMGAASRLDTVDARGESVPVLALHQVFGLTPDGAAPARRRIAAIVESEGRKLALAFDALIGQQRVLVKNLEANYRKIPGVSAAAVLGDGRVALILDLGHLVRLAGEALAA